MRESDPLIFRFHIVVEDLSLDKGIWPLIYKPIWILRILSVIGMGLYNIYTKGEDHFSPVLQVQLFIV